MRLEYLLLADKAEAINGKLYMLGGGIENVRVLSIPSLAAYDVVVSVKFSESESGDHLFELALLGEDNEELFGPFSSTLSAAFPHEGPESRVILVVRGPFPVPKAGRHHWQLRVDGQVLGDTPVAFDTLQLSESDLKKLNEVVREQGEAPSPGGSAESA